MKTGTKTTMTLADIEKTAVELKEKKENARASILQKKAAAEKKLEELVKQAAVLAREQQFDEYADNMEEQRKQNNIISAAQAILSVRPQEQEQIDRTELDAFYTQVQQSFDKDAAPDFKEMLKCINAAATAAEVYADKVRRANEARNKAATAYRLPLNYSGVECLLVLANAAIELRDQADGLIKIRDGER